MSQQISEYYRDLWCKGLRSGKVKQGRLLLRKDDSYCAVGVLLDVAGYKGEQRPTGGVYTFGVERSIAQAPRTACIKMGANASYLLAVSQLNDRGARFEELATIIESRKELPLV